MFKYNKDIHIECLDLWLDSKRVREFGFISHAHADHLARHKRILCSPATADLLKYRIKNPNFYQLEYGKLFEKNNHQITLYPAGHILGSAQIKIESENGSILYTGDFRMKSARTVEQFEQARADTVIMESTFGMPRFTMPDRADSEEELLELCKKCLKKGSVPIVLAYSLGKGQEILKLLSEADLPVAVDYSISRYAKVYEKYGITFGKYEIFKRSLFRDKILLLPVNYRYSRYIKSIPNPYTIYISGWALDPAAQNRFKVDKMIPISDHADYEELLQFVDAAKAKKVYCTHGFDEFVNVLRSRGFSAYPLAESYQLHLDL